MLLDPHLSLPMYKRHHKYLDALKDGVEFSSDSSDEASESGGAANQPDSSEDESGSEVEEFVVPTVFDEVEEEDSYDIIEERPLMEDELDAQLPEKHRKGEVTEYRCSMCPEKVLNSVSAVRAHLESKVCCCQSQAPDNSDSFGTPRSPREEVKAKGRIHRQQRAQTTQVLQSRYFPQIEEERP